MHQAGCEEELMLQPSTAEQHQEPGEHPPVLQHTQLLGQPTTREECVSSHCVTQGQYCDACNTACVFMTGRRRKLQVRYEGFVLVKRTPVVASSFMRASLPYVTAQPSLHGRRHSLADVLDDAADNHGPSVDQTRPPQNLLWPQQQPEMHAYEKIVNLSSEGGRVPLPTSEGSRVPLLPREESSVPIQSSISTSSSTVSMRQQSVVSSGEAQKCRSRREKKPRAHQRLCRKKSRSQDNLSGLNSSTVLNNSIQTPPLGASILSRSEGSIHNVHAITEGSGAESGTGGLARLPRKLLSKVTDEVGQWVFDMEGWNEQYITLNESSISIRNVSARYISDCLLFRRISANFPDLFLAA